MFRIKKFIKRKRLSRSNGKLSGRRANARNVNFETCWKTQSPQEHKALNGITPTYISELVELKPASKYNLTNSDDTLLLSNPSFKSRITLGDRSFKYAGPRLWNELPRDNVMAVLYIFLSVFSKLTCLGKPICFNYHWSYNMMIVNIWMIIKIVMIINTIDLIISHL